jgi:hypothetical protein
VLRSFTLKNFRGFRDLTVEPLDRINLIAGMNNTGKTSLLEAIYLHINPNKVDLALELNGMRGLGDAVDRAREKGAEANALEEICGWLFHSREIAMPIELTSRDDRGIERIAELRFADPATARADYPEISNLLAAHFPRDMAVGIVPHLVLRNRDSSGQEGFSTVCRTGFSTLSATQTVKPSGPSRLLNFRLRSSEPDIEEFSQIESIGRQEEILSALHVLEPRVQRLSLLVFAGQPEIHGNLGLKRLVPIALMGEGMRRLLSIVLAITNCPGGTVLIDEIENGLHHSVLQKVWTAIAHAARRADVQVFATTHSYECIEAAHEAFTADGTYDLRLHRLERVDDRITAVTYSQKTLDTSVEMNLEVR